MAQFLRISWERLALCFGLLGCRTSMVTADDFTIARTAVYFSPNGGATDAVVHEVTAAVEGGHP